MSRRSLATAIAVPLLVGLWLAAALVPVPYVTYHPGSTTDMLSETGGKERIQVSGHPAYYDDDGSLRMTTVSVTPPEDDVSIFEALTAWVSDEQAVEPYDAVYEQGETDKQSDTEGAVDMTTSQDAAIAVALTELGYKLPLDVTVAQVVDGMPADGILEPDDQLLRVNGTPVRRSQDVSDAAATGKPLALVVLRDGKRQKVTVTPKETDEGPRIGISLGEAYADFPFDVSVLIDPRIGGPSAGLMFSLAIYDTLTPGALTGGHDIAGTGEIASDGTVGPIGGIAQKVVGARDAGAQLFLVPAANCDQARGAPNGDMRLVRVETMPDALKSIQTWVDDPDADLPSCAKE